MFSAAHCLSSQCAAWLRKRARVCATVTFGCLPHCVRSSVRSSVLGPQYRNGPLHWTWPLLQPKLWRQSEKCKATSNSRCKAKSNSKQCGKQMLAQSQLLVRRQQQRRASSFVVAANLSIIAEGIWLLCKYRMIQTLMLTNKQRHKFVFIKLSMQQILVSILTFNSHPFIHSLQQKQQTNTFPSAQKVRLNIFYKYDNLFLEPY